MLINSVPKMKQAFGNTLISKNWWLIFVISFSVSSPKSSCQNCYSDLACKTKGYYQRNDKLVLYHSDGSLCTQSILVRCLKPAMFISLPFRPHFYHFWISLCFFSSWKKNLLWKESLIMLPDAGPRIRYKLLLVFLYSSKNTF